MKKYEYLENTVVREFTAWFSSKLNDAGLVHSYTLPSGTRLRFQGLPDALKQYDWQYSFTDPNGMGHAGSNYGENCEALAGLRSGLKAALASGNDRAVSDWASAVMGWGGVRNGNVKWLSTNVRGLAAEFGQTQTLLSGNDDEQNELRAIRRFNAGMTKVYSLLISGFVIYDSRVAGALAWFVRRWCHETGLQQVPDSLRFACMPAKEGDSQAIHKIRNPSDGRYSFPWMNNRPVRHAHWNLRASWVLSEALRLNTDSGFNRETDPLRALEAALFMWGYNLDKSASEETELDQPILGLDPVRDAEKIKRVGALRSSNPTLYRKIISLD